jgi:peptide/nickel transport system permease protein
MSAPSSRQRVADPAVVLLLAITALLISPVFAPRDPMTIDAAAALLPPNANHPLGTDQLGRDILSRLLHGGRRTAALALLSSSIAVGFGAALGILAARSGWSGAVSAALVQGLAAIPGLLFALALITLLGGGATQLALAVGFSQIAPVARLVQTAVRAAQVLPHVEAARALGANDRRLLRHHILPLIAEQVGAAAALAYSACLLNGAALSFLGLGGSPSVPDWGEMLFDGRQVFRVAPWVGFAPGIALTMLVWLANRLSQVLSWQTR